MKRFPVRLRRRALTVARFFESVPHGDVYLLSTILHDWDDDSAQRILETVRAAAGERLVVPDGVIEPSRVR